MEMDGSWKIRVEIQFASAPAGPTQSRGSVRTWAVCSRPSATLPANECLEHAVVRVTMSPSAERVSFWPSGDTFGAWIVPCPNAS